MAKIRHRNYERQYLATRIVVAGFVDLSPDWHWAQLLAPGPEDLNLIRLKGSVGGKNRHAFSTRLSYEKAIKGVAMMQRKVRNGQGVDVGDRERPNALPCHTPRDVAGGRLR